MREDKRAAVDSLVIALACWFNDAKAYIDLASIAEETMKRMDDPNKVIGFLSVEIGYSRHRHAVRLVCSHIEELVELIGQNPNLIEDEVFQDCIENLPDHLRSAWVECIDLGKRNSHSKDLRTLLQRVRANGTFHYYNLKHFGLGYKRYYLGKKHREAFLYFGNSLDQTHFVFADRAHESELERFTESFSNDELIRLTHGLCHAIRLIVVRYLDNHGAALFEDDEVEA
jgi:hypothetical protein